MFLNTPLHVHEPCYPGAAVAARPTKPVVGNTRYVRSMYQTICPVLEGLQASEGLEAADGAGTPPNPAERSGTIRDLA